MGRPRGPRKPELIKAVLADLAAGYDKTETGRRNGLSRSRVREIGETYALGDGGSLVRLKPPAEHGNGAWAYEPTAKEVEDTVAYQGRNLPPWWEDYESREQSLGVRRRALEVPRLLTRVYTLAPVGGGPGARARLAAARRQRGILGG